ncbi:hypothetical protein [Lishizhenia sp.]|uniref:hypothetical protein n=1 Tax=Lishizhenia sp. TaxID=2497594 RepID=UPI00299DDB89|nr:hypothetical protein [Lishizhenia sp.]MDX1444778.1 hypothetical protein [Lishizhenia sp.]
MSILRNTSFLLKLQLSFVVLLFSSGVCWGQSTHHIKSFNLSVGIEKPLSVIHDFDNDDDFKTRFYKAPENVPLGLSIHLSKNLSRQLQLQVTLLGRALGNTAYTYIQEKPIDGLNYTFSDSNFLRSNLLQLQIGCKYFLQKAPLGTYIHANFNTAFITNSIYRKSTFGSQFIQHTEVFNPEHHESILYGIDFGMGTTRMISDHFLLDYGFHISPFWFLFSKNTYNSDWIKNTVNAEGFIPGYSANNVEYLNKKLLSTEFLKLYIKIGFQKFRYE